MLALDPNAIDISSISTALSAFGFCTFCSITWVISHFISGLSMPGKARAIISCSSASRYFIGGSSGLLIALMHLLRGIK